MRLLLVAVSTLVLLPGCGTLANIDGREYALISLSGQQESRYYGGIRNDTRWIGISDGAPDVPARLLAGVFFIADMPLSFVADTITLPIVANQRRNRSFSPVASIPFPSSDP